MPSAAPPSPAAVTAGGASVRLSPAQASQSGAASLSPVQQSYRRRTPSLGGAVPSAEDLLSLIYQLRNTVGNLDRRLHSIEGDTNSFAQHPGSAAAGNGEERHTHANNRSLAGPERRATQPLSSVSPSGSLALALGGSPRRDQHDGDGDADAALTFEYLALGRDRKRGMTHQTHNGDTSLTQPLPTTKNILAAPLDRTIPASVCRSLIPDKALEFVVTYAKDAVIWQHACVHSHTFTREFEAFMSLESHERWVWTDPLWLALFFVVQSVAVHQMPPSDVASIFGDHSSNAPAMLLDAANRCLDTGHYLSEPSIYTCQALAILCVTGHNVADSNLLSSYLAIGIKTAQMLNLHRLGREAAQAQGYVESQGGVVTDSSPTWRDRIIQLEIGKRVWWSLAQQDYFAMPFCGSSMVNPRQHDTPMPANVHDDELDAGTLRSRYDESDLTLVQKLRLTAKCAQIIYTFFERLPQRDAASLEEHVQPYESELLALLPATQPRSTNPSLKFGLALRRYINVGVSHKILVLHRAFCSLQTTVEKNEQATGSLPTSQVHLSQARCLEAARQVLDQVRGINPSGRPEGQVGAMWTISYQAVAAAIVVALTFFRVSIDLASMPGCHVLRTEVMDARTVLHDLAQRSAIAARGVHLLDDLMRGFDDVGRPAALALQQQQQQQQHDIHSQRPRRSSVQYHQYPAAPGTPSILSQQGNTLSRPSTGAQKRPAADALGTSSLGSPHANSKRQRNGEAAAVPADSVLAQLEAETSTSSNGPVNSSAAAAPMPSWDLDWDVGSMLQTIPDVSKLFDGSMGNLFG